MSRTAMRVDPDIPGDGERHMWTRVTLRLADGRTLSIGPREVPGHPTNPLTDEALRDKFEECARLALPDDRVESVRQMLETLETCPDLRILTLDPRADLTRSPPTLTLPSPSERERDLIWTATPSEPPRSSAGFAGAILLWGETVGGGRRGPLPLNDGRPRSRGGRGA